MWSVDPLDWKDRSASLVTDRILKNTAPGAIILAHDIHQSTVDAMPATLDGLLSKGFKFATVSELIKMDQAQSVQSASTSPATPAAQPKASAAPYMR
jgi:peptidoglycan/xylan/chitin deacetylase (PgdA/CDA1 family)